MSLALITWTNFRLRERNLPNVNSEREDSIPVILQLFRSEARKFSPHDMPVSRQVLQLACRWRSRFVHTSQSFEESGSKTLGCERLEQVSTRALPEKSISLQHKHYDCENFRRSFYTCGETKLTSVWSCAQLTTCFKLNLSTEPLHTSNKERRLDGCCCFRNLSSIKRGRECFPGSLS